MATMAMIYFIFMSVNSMTYYAMTTLQTFSAILLRVSSIFQMEEYDFSRELSVEREKVQVTFTNADLTWGYKVKEKAAADSKEDSKNSPSKLKESDKEK
jgi:hypothetical protein